MPLQRITIGAIKAMQPGETLWDDGRDSVRGFGIRRQAADKPDQRRSATFILKYRFAGRQRFYTIGQFGSPWTVDKARNEAVRLLGLVAAGQDPAETKASDRQQQTLDEFFKVYIDEHAKGRKKPRSIAEDERNFKLHISPALGSRRLGEITKSDIATFHAARSARPVNANRCVALLSHIFTIALKRGALPEGAANPAASVTPYPEKGRERLLTLDEISRLGHALARAEIGWTKAEAAMLPKDQRPKRLSPEDWRAIALYRLLLFTGARLSEIQTLKWEYVDSARGVARLPDSKTGAKTIALPAAALEILETLPRFKGNPYVLPGTKKGTHFIGVQKPWQRIRALAGLAGTPEPAKPGRNASRKAQHPDALRIHDLRHAFASLAVASGESLFLVGKVLGHKKSATTERYAHLADSPVKAVADRTSSAIQAAMGQKSTPQSPATNKETRNN